MMGAGRAGGVGAEVPIRGTSAAANSAASAATFREMSDGLSDMPLAWARMVVALPKFCQEMTRLDLEKAFVATRRKSTTERKNVRDPIA
jgi:hypothetical protein